MIKTGSVLILSSLVLIGCSSGYPVIYKSFPESATLVCNGISKGYTPVTIRYDYDKDSMQEGDALQIENCRAVWISGAEAQYPTQIHYQDQLKSQSLSVERPQNRSGLQEDIAFDFQKKEADRHQKLEEERLKLEKERNDLLKESIENGEHYPHLSEYSKDGFDVYYGGQKVKEARASSFTVLNYGYAKDNWSVYYRGIKIKDARPRSFKVLAENYGEDHWDVYYRGSKIKDATRLSFKILDAHYSKDNRNVYYQGQKIEGANAARFVIESRGYARDHRHRYYRGKML